MGEKRDRINDNLKHRFERILEESNADSRLKKILIQTKNDTLFLRAYELSLDRAYGKCIQPNANINYETPRLPDPEAIDKAIAGYEAIISMAEGNEGVPTVQ